MSPALVTAIRPSVRLLASARSRRQCLGVNRGLAHRPLGSLFQRIKEKLTLTRDPTPTLSPENLFHPFSKSPFPAIRERGEAIKKLAPCPVCVAESPDVYTSPKAVTFECPECGWPTHCSEEHWAGDEEHKKYCSRLREVNEDDHDLRSGRRVWEFEFPGPQPFEETISFANWDVFWYTRQFPSMDTERSRRHVSKVLTYPLTIGSVLHQYSSLTTSNQRVTPEGSRSLAALRSTLHVPTGAPEANDAKLGEVRVFVLGARAESSLPPHCWDQLSLLFPSAHLHVHFIGPQVALPKAAAEPPSKESLSDKTKPPIPDASTKPEPTTNTSKVHNASSQVDVSSASSLANTASSSSSAAANASQHGPSIAVAETDKKSSYIPNVYEPATPALIAQHKWTRDSIQRYGVPSYTNPYKMELTLSGLRTDYMQVHELFQETYDPYSDVFFFFSPGFGFPSPTSVSEETGEPMLQIASPTEWGPVLPALLATKCAIFVTGFSPADVERDVKSLSAAPGVAGQFDWIVTPGPNPFGSEKWEVADFDPRVMVKVNWGIWGIRGKSRDIKERKGFDWLRLKG